MFNRKSRRMRFLWKLVLSAFIFSLTSCSAQWHLKRAVKKDATILRDTIVKLDTTIVTEEKNLVDTLVIQDTIVREIKSEGVVVRLQRIHDTIKVEAICESDTIKIVKEVEVVRYIQRKKRTIFDQTNMVIRSLILLLIIAIGFVITRKLLSK